jgi:hypothetical protein
MTQASMRIRGISKAAAKILILKLLLMILYCID